MIIPVGVTKSVITIGAEHDEVVDMGRLWIDPPPGTEELLGEVVIYTLDRVRLLGILAAARDGAEDDDILLALDAAALDYFDDDLDGPAEDPGYGDG